MTRGGESRLSQSSMRVTCPFSSPAYLGGLAHLGEVEVHPVRSVAVLKRPIPGTAHHDGVGPWPYRWISAPEDVEALCEGFRNLVTLTVVTQPGWRPPKTSGRDVRLLKQHFVFDPSLPTPELSRRSRNRLRKAERIGDFEVVTDPAGRLAIAEMYERLKARRNLLGGFFDLPRHHFTTIAALPNAVFFRVTHPEGIGAMACGIVSDDFLQVMHMVTTESGLTWNASYLLMKGLQDEARASGLRLLTGGMPASGSDGLRRFKVRWANAFLPVHLLCIVNDPATYVALSGARRQQTRFFPAYRDAT